MLFIHIFSSVIGIVTAGASGFYSIYKNKKIIWIISLTLLSLIISIISGRFLMEIDPTGVFHSGKLVSNIIITFILLIIEILFFFTTLKRDILINRTISLFSWIWIFVVAWISPSTSYLFLLSIYIVTGIVIVICVQRTLHLEVKL